MPYVNIKVTREGTSPGATATTPAQKGTAAEHGASEKPSLPDGSQDRPGQQWQRRVWLRRTRNHRFRHSLIVAI
jgi:hypothetical protein